MKFFPVILLGGLVLTVVCIGSVVLFAGYLVEEEPDWVSGSGGASAGTASGGGPIGLGTVQGDVKLGENTMTNLMRAAGLPIGKVMYSWGGGRVGGPKETGGAPIGIPEEWTKFYDKYQKPNKAYNFRVYRAGGAPTETSRKSGLDCSGYIGWMLGSVRYDGNMYGVVSGSHIGQLTGMGLGKRLPNPFSDYKPGDILANGGHVVMVIGPSEHGGAVIAHASPHGVKLGGIDGGVQTAEAYMSKYFPEVSDKNKAFNFGTFNVTSYKGKYQQFRWNIVKSGDRKGIEDPDGLYNMTAEQILKKMFGSL